MIQILLVCHGRFAEGVLDTLRMVCGSDFGIRSLSLVPGESPEEYRQLLSNALEECEAIDHRGTLVLADIAGGTPFNSAVYLTSRYRMGIVAGVNVAAVMSLALEREQDDTIEALLDKARDALVMGMKFINSKDVRGEKHARLSACKD